MLYIKNELIKSLKDRVFSIPKSKQFNEVMDYLFLSDKVESDSTRIKLAIAIRQKSEPKLAYFKEDDIIEPLIIKSVETYVGHDVFATTLLNMVDALNNKFGADFCDKYMPKSQLSPYGFFKDGYLYICFCLFLEEDAIIELSDLDEANIGVDTYKNICDFSNLSFRGKMIIQPLK